MQNHQASANHQSWMVWPVLSLAILAAYVGAFALKQGLPLSSWSPWFARGLLVVLITKLGVLGLFGVHRGMWRYASLHDLMRTTLAMLCASLLLMVTGIVMRIPEFLFPLLAIDLLISLLMLSYARMSMRVARFLMGSAQKGRRAIVIGAGDAGEAVLRILRSDPGAEYQPIALVDDDPSKQGLRIHGTPVEGTIEDLPELASRLGADAIILAIGRELGPERSQELAAVVRRTGLPVKKIPSLEEMFGGRARIEELRDFKLEELLHRAPIQTERREVDALIQGRVVLVTGAAGSIGSELCRQVLGHEPSRLVILDQNENALFEMEHECKLLAPEVSCRPVLGSVRDRAKMLEVFSSERPDVVFHAAAYKHVPVLEHFPEEAVLNNVCGTRNMAELASEYGVDRFVLISTDKAVRPTSVMGASKRIAECIVGGIDCDSGTRFATIRFGNVLGSNGSVVQLFRKQIAAGGPVTVTDPEIKRFFMSIPEAVELVLFAAAMSDSGRTYILDMGKQVRVLDLARHFIRLCGLEPEKDIPIEIVGLRPGEKLYEELWVSDEEPEATSHPSVLAAPRVGRSDLGWFKSLDNLIVAARTEDRGRVLELLQELVPEYRVSRDPGSSHVAAAGRR